MATWETFHHEADIGIRGRGATLTEAFAHAALALTSVITDPAKVACRERVTIRCQAPDAELLFLDWINALVYEMATRKLLFSQFHIAMTDTQLDATICGEEIDRRRHDPAVEVKGATFTELRVAKGESGEWIAQCVVDV